MRILFKIALFLTIPFLGFVACDKEDIVIAPTLDVIPSNLDGVWKLAEVNGEAESDDTYVYMVLTRRDTKFEIYSNKSSMYAVKDTGKYSIKKDEDGVSTLSGKYDFGKGNWNNTYVVSDLNVDSMIWVVTEGDEVSKYIRVDDVPEDILAEANR